MDLDNKPGNEIVKINNYISENVGEVDDIGLYSYLTDGPYADYLAFAVYTINASGELEYLYTKTFQTTFEVKNDNRNSYPIYKEFFSGDFNGDGKNEILAVSSLRTTKGNKNQIPRGEIYDLESDSVLYRNAIFADIQVKPLTNNPPGQHVPITDETDRIRLITGDFNGNGKTDFFYLPENNQYGAFIEFEFDGSTVVPKKSSTDIDVGRNNNTIYQTGDFNGDGRTDLFYKNWYYEGPGGVFFSDGKNFDHKSLEEIGDFSRLIKVATEDMNDDGQSDLTLIESDKTSTYFFDKGEIIAVEQETIGIPNYYVLAGDNYLTTETTPNELVFVNGDSIVRLSFEMDLSKSLVMTGVKSGFDIVTHFEYGKLTDENTYTATTTSEAGFSYQNISRNSTVVNRMRTCHKDAILDVKTYRYQNGIRHHQGLGFCGFEQITVTDSLRNQAVVRTFDPLHFGVLTSEDSPANRLVNTYKVDVAANKIAKVTLSHSVATDKLKNITKTTTYSHDTYGNTTQIITDYGGGLKTTIDNLFSNFTASPYRLGELKQRAVKNECSGQSAVTTKTVFTYNSVGLPLTKMEYYNANKVSEENFVYDANNWVREAKIRTYSSTNWQTKTYEYDDSGRLTKETDPIGLFTEYVYNSKGQLEALIDHRRNETTFEYDNWGRKTKTTYPDGTVETSSVVFVSSPKDAWIRETRIADGKPSTVTFFDAMMREIRTGEQRFNSSVVYINKKYDNFGRLWKVSLPFKNSLTQWNEYKYDNFDRITEIAYASGKRDRFAYDGNSVASTIDGVTKTTRYNAKGEITSITDATGTITYNLRADGQPTSITAPYRVTTAFSYDTYGRRNGINDPSAGIRVFRYDAAGNIILEEDARNRQIYTYDSRNRLTRKEIAGEQTLNIVYNADNLPQSAISNNGTKIEYAYDTYLRPSTITETGLDGKWLRKTIEYETGNVKTINYASNSGKLATENYRYAYGHNIEVTLTSPYFSGAKSVWKLTAENAMGQATGATTGTLNRSYSYDSFGLPAARKIYKSETLDITARPFVNDGTIATGRMMAATASNSTATDLADIGAIQNDITILQDFRYSFDAQTGNLNWRKDVSNSRNLQESFAYDVLKRLTRTGNASINYDSKGNIIENSATGAFEYADAAKPYQMTMATPYDNATPVRVQDITYNALQRPVSITENGHSAILAYNADGDRVKMSLRNGKGIVLTRHYFGNKYEIDETPAGTKEKLYLCGDAYSAPAVFVRESGTWKLYYIGRDYQGSITHIFNEDGTVKQELSYDAWGRLRDPAGHRIYAVDREPELFLGRGYTGHEHLTQFGLINMNARLYDAALGRFLSPDPYIQDATNSQNYNRYSYCLNNPLKYTDPSGLEYTDPYGGYHWDQYARCYRDEWDNKLDYSYIYHLMFYNGYFRPGGSMFHRGASYGGYGGGYGGSYGYGGYGYIGGNPPVVTGLRSNLPYYFWNQSVFVEGVYSEYGYQPTAIGIINTRVPLSQQAQDWLNATSFITKVDASVFTSLERLSFSEGYWLGKNGKYYKTSWGGNQYTGSRVGAIKVAKLYKGAGWAATGIAGIIDIGMGYMEDSNTVGYNI
ncbi:MAG: hypothetical protein LBB85_00985 [Dysgonamonadaceae bacterium]|jgi:RHS repeat-associated protein|nr:hypothetical protein [Dysgonamonadaceae bacterium]